MTTNQNTITEDRSEPGYVTIIVPNSMVARIDATNVIKALGWEFDAWEKSQHGDHVLTTITRNGYMIATATREATGEMTIDISERLETHAVRFMAAYESLTDLNTIHANELEAA